ncbi:hypothetical protein SADUNF_Sadunf04G0159100 [Salix dunnii]|uniref:Uncharacterized protein n=1 Tax=Salix dunnii TaxID=1413687 RepID=A0A835K5Z5_9ROSI|nr:hypothetical protein SADUNF_Sadunf04G0159100 [Salix dunnii]
MTGFEEAMSTLMSVMLRKNFGFFQELAILLMDVISLLVSAIRYNSASHSRHSNTAIFRRHSNTAIFRRHSLAPSMAARHDR